VVAGFDVVADGTAFTVDVALVIFVDGAAVKVVVVSFVVEAAVVLAEENVLEGGLVTKKCKYYNH